MDPSSPEISPPDLGERDRAREAWTFGLVALALVALDGCSGALTLLAALPLGWVAMSRARVILGRSPSDGITEVYARTAQITGMVAAIVSGLWILFYCGVFTIYASMIGFIASQSPNFPPPP